MRHHKVFKGQVRESVLGKKEPMELYKRDIRSSFTIGEGKNRLLIPVHFVVQGLPSVQRALLFSKESSVLRFEKGKDLNYLIKRKPLWFKMHAGKVVDSMAEALFEQAVQRGVKHEDLNQGNMLIQKKKKLFGKPEVKVKTIDWDRASVISENFEREEKGSKIVSDFSSKGPNQMYHVIHSLSPGALGASNAMLDVIGGFPVSEKKKKQLKQRFLSKIEKLAEERL